MKGSITTECRNQKTMILDEMSTSEFLHVMNEEDLQVPKAIKLVIPQIEKTVEMVVESFRQGGRLIYIGAGTSGRLGILDAVECVPTFGTSKEMVQGLIAGGDSAIKMSVEGAEDSKDLAVKDLKDLNLNVKDTLIGIAASGRTPYVIGGLEYARSIGVKCASISCNRESLIGKVSDIAIDVSVGPEVITGSTRLKAGSAQKMILNMISTASMVAIGKTYGNLMVDVQMTNIKLVERGKQIVMEATGVDYEQAEKVLEESKNSPKVAIIMILIDCSREEAVERLNRSNGFVKKALSEVV